MLTCSILRSTLKSATLVIVICQILGKKIKELTLEQHTHSHQSFPPCLFLLQTLDNLRCDLNTYLVVIVVVKKTVSIILVVT